MPSWWDSIEILGRCNYWLQVAVVVATVVVGLAGTLSFLATTRLAVLQEAERERLQQRVDIAEQKLATRVLSPDQQHRLLQVLNDGRATGSILVKLVDGDQEAAALAAQLSDLLMRAGWNVMGPFVERTSELPTPEISVLVSDATSLPLRARILLGGLRLVGLEARLVSSNDGPSDVVAMHVGHRAAR